MPDSSRVCVGVHVCVYNVQAIYFLLIKTVVHPFKIYSLRHCKPPRSHRTTIKGNHTLWRLFHAV